LAGDAGPGAWGAGDLDKAAAIERSVRTGQPLGSEAFVADLEAAPGRSLKSKNPVRKKREVNLV